MKMAEVNAMTDAELRQKSLELRSERLNLRLQQQTGRLEKPSRLRDVRRDLARVETALSGRKGAKA
ncbi:MAG: 50S ribosomal protein L29 [Candidatus Methylacidiphilales bacterium]